MESIYKLFERIFVASIFLLILIPTVGDYIVKSLKVASGDFTLAVLAFTQLAVVSGLLTLIFESTRNDLMSLGASKSKRGIEYMMMGLLVALAYPITIIIIAYLGVSPSVSFLASMATLTFLFLFGAYALNYAGFELTEKRFSRAKIGRLASLLGLFIILISVVGIPVLSLEFLKGITVDFWLIGAGVIVNAVFVLLLLSYLLIGMEAGESIITYGSILAMITFVLSIVKFAMVGHLTKSTLLYMDVAQLFTSIGLAMIIYGLAKLRG